MTAAVLPFSLLFEKSFLLKPLLRTLTTGGKGNRKNVFEYQYLGF